MTSTDIILEKIDEVWIGIKAEPAIIKELSDILTFDVPGARYSPAFKKRFWDGKIRLIKKNNTTYRGIEHYIFEHAEKCGYSIKKTYNSDEFSPDNFYNDFIQSMKFYKDGSEIQPKDYQLDTIKKAIQDGSGTFLSPTASGKSLMIYALLRFYLEHTDGKILLLCPTTSLVEQFYSDILDYADDNFHVEKYITKVYGGTAREDKRIEISTWQSKMDLPKEHFLQFDTVIMDECHGGKAKEICKIIEKCSNAKYRFGFTGTLSGQNIHQYQVESLFGKVHQVIRTSTLIETKQLSDLKVYCLVLNYPESVREKRTYPDEIEFLINHERRNQYIADVASQLEGNTLVLFTRIEHGKRIYNWIKENNPDKPVFFIYGKTETEIREQIRKDIEKLENGIAVASINIMGTGINIPSLKNIIFTHPSKSRIKVLQAIGRILRLSKNKVGSIVYDIVDDLRMKGFENFSYRHYKERCKLYSSEDFDYKNVKLVLE